MKFFAVAFAAILAVCSGSHTPTNDRVQEKILDDLVSTILSHPDLDTIMNQPYSAPPSCNYPVALKERHEKGRLEFFSFDNFIVYGKVRGVSFNYDEDYDLPGGGVMMVMLDDGRLMVVDHGDITISWKGE